MAFSSDDLDRARRLLSLGLLHHLTSSTSTLARSPSINRPSDPQVLQLYHRGGENSLLSLFIRDGAYVPLSLINSESRLTLDVPSVYTFVVFAVYCVNAVFFAQSNVNIQATNANAAFILPGLVVSRMILRLRMAGERQGNGYVTATAFRNGGGAVSGVGTTSFVGGTAALGSRGTEPVVVDLPRVADEESTGISNKIEKTTPPRGLLRHGSSDMSAKF